MSNITTLNDGQYFDLGYKSPNEFGAEIDFYTDPLTGADPFRAAIPNPPLIFEWPENWGQSGLIIIPDNPIEPVPEPGYGFILVLALVSIIMYKMFRKDELMKSKSAALRELLKK
jgi:hypothetical protein